jgi:hypothetical protein
MGIIRKGLCLRNCLSYAFVVMQERIDAIKNGGWTIDSNYLLVYDSL